MDPSTLVPPLKGPLATIFGPAARELGEMLGDRMRVFRFRNLASVLAKVQRIAEERGIPAEHLKALPFGDAIKAVDGASQEEDDTVQELWARLISNATDPGGSGCVDKIVVELLKSLTATEAVLLDLLRWADLGSRRFGLGGEIDAFNLECVDRAAAWRAIDGNRRSVAEQNLLRLRCIAPTPNIPSASNLIKQQSRSAYNLDGERRIDVKLDTSGLERLLQNILKQQLIAAGVVSDVEPEPIALRSLSGFASFYRHLTAPEMRWMLTALGAELMHACAS